MKKSCWRGASILFLLFFLGCQGDDEHENQGGTHIDLWWGLEWQSEPRSLDYDEGVGYCDDLVLDAHEDWRLPTLVDLRTLIMGCAESERLGACPVGRTCEPSEPSCFDPAVCLCEENGGLGEGGCYWDTDVWGPDCGTYWAESDAATGTVVAFSTGGVGQTAPAPNMTRCVRDVDCREPDLDCRAPFHCDQAGGLYLCASDTGDGPDCSGTPDGQAVPFETAGNLSTLHWLPEPGCIPTTYDPDLSRFQSHFQAAIEAWNGVSCAAICLEPLTEATDRPADVTAERRIHFEPMAGNLAQTSWSVNYEVSTGRIFNVLIRITVTRDGSEPVSIAKALGHALGLDVPTENVDSVMRNSQTVTALDEQALCRLYGDPPYCE